VLYNNTHEHSVEADSGNGEFWALILDQVLVGLLCLLLAFGPLAFGAVQPWSICILQLGAAFCVLLWALRQFAGGTFEFSWNPLFLPALLFAALIAVQLLTARTAYWFATWQSSLLWSAYGMLFFVATQCFRTRSSFRAFALFFTAYGFLVAFFAVVQQFTWNGNLYWLVPVRSGSGYGPYVDHSHYAGLMEMLTPIPLVFAMMDRWQKAQRILFGFAALLMASTIFLCKSFGGMLSFTVEMMFFGLLLSVRQRSRIPLLLLLVLAVLLSVWLAVFSPGGISQRIASEAVANDRLPIVRDSLKLIAARPILGWGLGTFPVVYPSFRSFHTNYFVNAAHNDYIQTAAETGILGLLATFGFATLLYRKGIREAAGWRKSVGTAVSMAALIGVTGLLVHSLCDFNLQIPANAALFFVLSAIATADHNRRQASKQIN
jgi:O-antigen ligase